MSHGVSYITFRLSGGHFCPLLSQNEITSHLQIPLTTFPGLQAASCLNSWLLLLRIKVAIRLLSGFPMLI